MYDAGLTPWSDAEIVRWANERSTIVVTYDEDLADPRRFPLGTHSGIVRPRVTPTTFENTVVALAIVDNDRVRVLRAGG